MGTRPITFVTVVDLIKKKMQSSWIMITQKILVSI